MQSFVGCPVCGRHDAVWTQAVGSKQITPDISVMNAILVPRDPGICALPLALADEVYLSALNAARRFAHYQVVKRLA